MLISTGNSPESIRGENDLANFVLSRTIQCLEQPAIAYDPNANHTVIAAGRDQLTVWAEGKGNWGAVNAPRQNG